MLDINFWNILFTVINLLILYVGIRIFLFKPINNIIEKRQEEADKQIKDAEAAKASAEEMQAECAKTVQELKDSRDEQMAQSRKDATAEYERIVTDAKASARTIVDDAKVAAEQEKEKILRSAEAEISDMVVAATVKAMAAQSSPENDKQLYDQFLDKVGDSLDEKDV